MSARRVIRAGAGRTHRWSVVCAACVALFPALCRQVPAAVFDPTAFSSMQKSDRLNAVLAGMRQREGELQNSEYEMTTTSTGTTEEGNSKTVWKLQVKTFGSSFYFAGNRTTDAINGEHFEESRRGSWDGAVLKRSGTSDPKRPSRGVIEMSKDAAYKALPSELLIFLGQLGTQFQPVPPFSTVADYIELGSQRPNLQWDIQSATERNEVGICCTLWDSLGHRYEYFVVPTQGFVIKRHSVFEQRGRIINDTTEEVREIDGRFVPWRVVRVWSIPGVTSTTICEVSNCRIGKVSTASLAMEFEQGSIIADNIDGGVYRVTEGQQRQRLRSVNPLTGSTTGPSPAESPKARTQTVEEMTANVNIPASRGGDQPTKTVAIIAAFVGLGGVVLGGRALARRTKNGP